MVRTSLFLAIVGCALMAPSWAGAQNRGNFDPAQFRERRLTQIKEQLGSTDDEWKVLSPKIVMVMTAQLASFGGGGGGGRRTTDANATPPDTSTMTPIQKASSDLRTILNNKDASADDIKAKLAALREAREKVKADLTAAQKELKEVLTQRQEAVLVTNGMLD
jgi:hypothetical protein